MEHDKSVKLNPMQNYQLMEWVLKHRELIEDCGAQSMEVLEQAQTDLPFTLNKFILALRAKAAGFKKRAPERPAPATSVGYAARVEKLERDVADLRHEVTALRERLDPIVDALAPAPVNGRQH